MLKNAVVCRHEYLEHTRVSHGPRYVQHASVSQKHGSRC
jgi:hypothetical protein